MRKIQLAFIKTVSLLQITTSVFYTCIVIKHFVVMAVLKTIDFVTVLELCQKTTKDEL